MGTVYKLERVDSLTRLADSFDSVRKCTFEAMIGSQKRSIHASPPKQYQLHLHKNDDFETQFIYILLSVNMWRHASSE